MATASIFGRLLPNVLADIIGPFNNYIPACVTAGVLLFGLLGIKTLAGIIVFAILWGFFTGAGM